MDKDDQELTKLQLQLNEALVARGGLDDSFGVLLVELFSKHITKLTRDVTSDKFRKDHVGYNNALSDINAYRTILRDLQVLGHPARIKKLKEKLDSRED